jgi:hypothetical protein
VHPSRYTFIVNGPDCSCTHSRLAHVGENKYGLPAADVGCSECGLCEHFTPLEAIDRVAEDAQRDELLANQARRSKIHRRVASLLLAPLVLMVPAAIWAPGLAPWLAATTIIASLANAGISSLSSWRAGDLDNSEAVLQLGMGVGIVGFFAALLVGATTLAYVLLTITLAFTFGLGFVTQRWLKRSVRSMNLLMVDLKKEQGDQP